MITSFQLPLIYYNVPHISDPNRRSVFDSALNFLIGDQLEDSSGSLADGKDVAATHSDSTGL